MHREFKAARSFVLSLEKDSDPVLSLQKFCAENRIEKGFLWGIGALSKAIFGYYRIEEDRYQTTEKDEFLEMLNCQGNISLKNSEIFLHLHVTLADVKGILCGGHLMEGSRVFAGEFFLQEIAGEPLVREKDPATGLFLWRE